MLEGSRHFDEKSAVFDALRNITKRLEEFGIPYGIVGGMAMFRHGFRRYTEDVDLLVTRESLDRIHKELTGLGYLPPHANSRHLRDTSNGVRVEFLVTGDFPGDGKEKPVAFPDPTKVTTTLDGARYVQLPTLVELKLASGISAPGRLKDLADVQELIKILKLPRDFAGRLHPYVQERFTQLWDDAAGSQ
ncbi:hypothetical protein AYO47_03320 [Planctomyces sp. SCGC AG-212-M04]|nr:hypothetical protein AYO47_03320 [Planctomyces sp. SCGC AG-212-M04]